MFLDRCRKTSWGIFVTNMTERRNMMKYHQLTNVTAIMTIFVVLLLSGNVATSGERHSQSWAGQQITVVEPSESETPSPNRRLDTKTENMKLAYTVGSEVGNPETLQAILLVETRGGEGSLIGGKSLPIVNRSYGIMQIQIGTARSVFERTGGLINRYFPDRNYKSITNQEIIDLLLTNNEANMRIAAHNFRMNMSFTKGNWDRAVAAYNVGIGRVLKSTTSWSEYGYVKLVKSKLKTPVRLFNKDQISLLTL